jgi:hypothetical protein
VEFPKQHEQPNTTQFLFELSPSAPTNRIKNDLRAFDPNQLLFLRRLQRVEVGHEGKWMTVKREDFEEFKDYGGQVRRLIVSEPSSQSEVVTDYIVVRHKIKLTQRFAKRVGIDETEVALVFPIALDCPVIQPQYAYNFLPIRKTTFFVIAVVFNV